MVEPHPAVNWLVQPGENNGQFSKDDLELAYLLQHSQPGDVQVHCQLVQRFAAEIHRLVAGWLVFNQGNNASPEKVRGLVIDILAGACLQVEGFRGEESVRNWIYRLAIKRLAKLSRWKLPSRKKAPPLVEILPLVPVWHLSRSQRSILWLRYGMELSLPDCSFVLDSPQPKIQSKLHSARSSMVPEVVPAEHGQDCCTCWQAIWDRSDGLLKEDVQTDAQLASHLLGCPQCQKLADLAGEFEQSLSEAMASNWPLPVLREEDIHRITADIPTYEPKNHLPMVAPRWIKAGWTGLIIIAFVAAGIFWMGKTRQESDQPLIATPEAERFPALIQSVPATELAIQDQADVLDVQYIAQDQSDDGNWIVYTIYEIQLGDPDYAFHSLVYLYDPTTKISQNLFESVQVAQPNVQTWLNAPVISADGERVVFSAPHASEDGEACVTPEGLACLDIYMYQRSSAELTRITHSWTGSPSDGDSHSPAISADGQVITFWSTAQNLIAGPDEACATEERIACTQAYIYNVASGELAALRLSHIQGTSGVDRMSLSADGSVITLTTFAMASGDTLSHYYTYLYDRNSGVIEDLDHAVDGTPGNGSAYGAVLDASGRYVAFASDSSNLVPDDTNGFTDVFWYDRQTGELIRVNMGPGGEQADDHSGILAPGVAFNSLDMSADGQQLIYLSLASNLVENPGECSLADESMCNALYYYNHQTGQTELIAPRRNNGFTFFPTITSSGRWIAYTGLQQVSQPLYYCSDIFRLDRQRDWTDKLAGFTSDFPSYAWLVGGSMSLQGTHTNDLAFSPNGEFVAAANSDGRVRVFQISDASLYTAFQKDESSPVVHLDISPDNRLLAGGTALGEVKIWDLQQKRLLFVLDDLPGKVIDLFFSPDSSLITIITPELASVWQFGDNVMTRLRNIPLGKPRVQDTDLAPAGNLLATARQDGTVWLQLLPNGVVLARLAGGEAAMYDVTFSLDGTRLASRSLDGTVNVWQIDWSGFGALEATSLASYLTPDWYGNLAFLADGSSLASIRNTGGFDIWDLNDGRTYQVVTPLVDRLAFAPQGDTLAAATFGSLDLWRGPGLTPGQYFTHVESDTLVNQESVPISAANDLGLTQWLAAQNRSRSLYEVDDVWPADLVAPARLPEGIIFQGAYLTENEIAFLHYDVDSGSGSPAGLYILEQPASDDSQAMRVGESAQVHQRAVGDILFEFVSGDWLPDESAGADSPAVNWKWDNSANSSRLRWQSGDLLIAMYYPAAEAESRSLDMEDMLQIAAGFQQVTLPAQEVVEIIPYLVQPGDTCTWIANRFWVEIEDIIRANNLGGSCDTIFAGQELLVPISHLSYISNEVDFDCDGIEERVEVIMGTRLWMGVRLLVQSDTGFFVPAWEWILDETSTQRFNLIRAVTDYDCTTYLAVEVITEFQSSWSVFTWDGQTMHPVEIDLIELELLFRR